MGYDDRLSAFLVNAIDDMAFLKDENLRYLFVNNANAAFFGRTPEEVTGLTDTDLMPPESARACRESDLAALRSRRLVISEEKTGNQTYETRKFPVPLGNGRTGVGGFIRDTSEKGRLEVQLLQARKMEAVGRLAGGVAHDFNNLLSVVLGYCELLLAEENLSQRVMSGLDAIHDAGCKARDLTRQLLAFSRRQVLEIRVIDLGGVLAGLNNLLRHTLGDDIVLEIILHPEPVLIKADSSQIEQVLLNLAINARDAMPEGGILTIESGVSRVGSPPEIEGEAADHAFLRVSDQGVGMDAETLGNIFEPFFTTKPQEKGTGLGLSTVYGIVKQHGGTIAVVSHPGQGSTFTIHFPLSSEILPDVVKTESPGETSAVPATILVVEDEPIVRSLAACILESSGYRVLVTDSTEDAVRTAKVFGQPIDLVLTDMVMPGMKGPEVYRAVLGTHQEARVLYMSGYASGVISSHGFSPEAANFIRKPFSVTGLLDKVAEVLKGW
ncbi:MAG: ATP-binding protein [Candidatus Fermentibacteraceae bacterium]